MELIFRSQERKDRLLDVAALTAPPHVRYIPLTPHIAMASIYLRKTLDLTFVDSYCAAAALAFHRTIISFDVAYEKAPGLIRIKPETL